MTIDHFPVEAGHIMLFARAIGDPNPAYYGGIPAAGGTTQTVAPPTFVQAGAQFDADYPLRPRLGEPWFGSGATTSGAARPNGGDGNRLHAEQWFEYHRPVRPGDVLHTTTSAPSHWEKTNRRGQTLRFQQDTTRYLTAAEEPAVTARRVSVIVPPHTNDAAQPRVGTPGGGSVTGQSASQGAGMHYEASLTHNLTRTQIVQYAGASGDYNPLHTDEVYATRSAGYPNVIAHGMLTMGMTARLLTDSFGVLGLLSFGGRFTAQVHPGDSLTAVATAGHGDQRTVQLRIVTSNQDGVPVFVGEATAKPG